MTLQTVVHRFFTSHLAGGKSAKGLNNAILGWQAAQGYIHPSVTVNWMAIAQDNDIKYLGDIHMQNGFATGKMSIAPSGPSMTLTAASLSVLMGYNPSFSLGSISAEPIAGHTLDLFYSRSDNHTTTVQFEGNVLPTLSGLTLHVNGVAKPVTTAWIYDPTPGINVSAAGWDTELFTAAVPYTISWS